MKQGVLDHVNGTMCGEWMGPCGSTANLSGVNQLYFRYVNWGGFAL